MKIADLRIPLTLDTTSFIGYNRLMEKSEEQRKRKGEGSLFQYDGYWFYTYGYSIDGRQRKKKKCLGSIQKFKTEAAAWTEAKRFRDKFITDIKTGKVAAPQVESVTCGELLTQYVAHLKAQKKPAAYVIEKMRRGEHPPVLRGHKGREAGDAPF